jgi:hypothetical protein
MLNLVTLFELARSGLKFRFLLITVEIYDVYPGIARIVESYVPCIVVPIDRNVSLSLCIILRLRDFTSFS